MVCTVALSQGSSDTDITVMATMTAMTPSLIGSELLLLQSGCTFGPSPSQLHNTLKAKEQMTGAGYCPAMTPKLLSCVLPIECHLSGASGRPLFHCSKRFVLLLLLL